ncbi:MAG: hypothetical protein Fues2KO_23270 [Fuerstiella sp.]
MQSADEQSETQSTGVTAFRIAVVVLVAASAGLLIVLAATWTEAWQTGALPNDDAWQYYDETGNGPWNHNQTMLACVNFVFAAAFITLVAGIATLILGQTVALKLYGGLASTGSLVSMWYHYLLID